MVTKSIFPICPRCFAVYDTGYDGDKTYECENCGEKFFAAIAKEPGELKVVPLWDRFENIAFIQVEEE